MPNIIVVGAQWGDEGKGKVVDLYTEFADVVVRYAGGANAGHTVVIDGEQTILHLLPSGILHKNKTCVVGNGVVIELDTLWEELENLRGKGLLDDTSRIHISERAHLVMPYHKQLDAAQEKAAGKESIGTTMRGIGPTYTDKIARRGLRIIDLYYPDAFKSVVAKRLEQVNPYLEKYGQKTFTVNEIMDWAEPFAERMKPFVADVERVLDEHIQRGSKILFEGAQGTLLDIDHGSYPYVTSSNTTAGNACCGAGIGPTRIDSVIGISKAYCTRVGGGPFPSELDKEMGDKIREAGGEYGATTGRPRRCGWIDIVGLKRAVRINGLTGLAITKLDVLSDLEKIGICTAYELDGKKIDHQPAQLSELARIEPVLEFQPGWQSDISDIRTFDELPKAAQRYLNYVEQLLGVPVVMVGVGAGRNQTIMIDNPFHGEKRQ